MWCDNDCNDCEWYGVCPQSFEKVPELQVDEDFKDITSEDYEHGEL